MINCVCDYQSHGHQGVCGKEITYADSQLWEECDHTERTIVDGKIENETRNECYCKNNRCCLECYTKEVSIAKGSIARSLKIMNQNYKAEL